MTKGYWQTTNSSSSTILSLDLLCYLYHVRTKQQLEQGATSISCHLPLPWTSTSEGWEKMTKSMFQLTLNTKSMTLLNLSNESMSLTNSSRIILKRVLIKKEMREKFKRRTICLKNRGIFTAKRSRALRKRWKRWRSYWRIWLLKSKTFRASQSPRLLRLN